MKLAHTVKASLALLVLAHAESYVAHDASSNCYSIEASPIPTSHSAEGSHGHSGCHCPCSSKPSTKVDVSNTSTLTPSKPSKAESAAPVSNTSTVSKAVGPGSETHHPYSASPVVKVSCTTMTEAAQPSPASAAQPTSCPVCTARNDAQTITGYYTVSVEVVKGTVEHHTSWAPSSFSGCQKMVAPQSQIKTEISNEAAPVSASGPVVTKVVTIYYETEVKMGPKKTETVTHWVTTPCPVCQTTTAIETSAIQPVSSVAEDPAKIVNVYFKKVTTELEGETTTVTKWATTSFEGCSQTSAPMSELATKTTSNLFEGEHMSNVVTAYYTKEIVKDEVGSSTVYSTSWATTSCKGCTSTVAPLSELISHFPGGMNTTESTGFFDKVRSFFGASTSNSESHSASSEIIPAVTSEVPITTGSDSLSTSTTESTSSTAPSSVTSHSGSSIEVSSTISASTESMKY